MSQVIVMLTTWPDESGARAAAESWVNKKLAACVNILPPMLSIYHWDGELNHGHEHQLIIKTTRNQCDALKQMIQQTHPYECPEILQLPVEGGHPPYLNWITGYTQ